MKKTIEQRLAALEKTRTKPGTQPVTRIELVDGETGEVGAVIHVGVQPDQEGVMQALKYKHETDPPRTLKPRQG